MYFLRSCGVKGGSEGGGQMGEGEGDEVWEVICGG